MSRLVTLHDDQMVVRAEPPVRAMIEDLWRTGLYGRTRDEVATNLMLDQLKYLLGTPGFSEIFRAGAGYYAAQPQTAEQLVALCRAWLNQQSCQGPFEVALDQLLDDQA